jgi:hypothetical protein
MIYVLLWFLGVPLSLILRFALLRGPGADRVSPAGGGSTTIARRMMH